MATVIAASATARYVRTSAQKAGLVLDLIRGKDVNRALATLKYTRKGIADDIAKVLRSAIANAQNREGFSGDVDRSVRVGVLRESGAISQARASGTDGSRVPCAEADGASDRARVGTAGKSRRGRRDATPAAEDNRPKRPQRQKGQQRAEVRGQKPAATKSKKVKE